MKVFLKSFFIIFCLTLSFIHEARADLLVSPLRVTFDGRDRSQLVTLINNSDKTRTYRIEWLEKKMNEEGQYTDINPSVDYIGASNLIRYSPRQVTLAPNEKQAIRMALRKPADLADGEYRSHILFKQLANIEDENEPVEGPTIKLYVNVSISIPVIVRQGNRLINTQLSDIQLSSDDEGKKGFKIKVTRAEGSSSPYGSIVIYDPRDIKKQNPLGILNNIAVYPEVEHRNVFVYLQNNIPPDIKEVLVVYEGKEEYADQILYQKTYTLP